MVPASRDLTFLDGIGRAPHDTFNVGYVGTVDVAKMHPNFVALSARVDVPHVRFVVCGRGNGFRAIRRQAERLGVGDRFVLRGFVPDLRDALATFDVFGYPLGPENYSSAELVLHEAMYAGIPPVILRRGGAQSTVIHAETGLVVDTDDEYVDAIAHLYRRPGERARLGANAARYARALFGVERTADGWSAAYERVMRRPKRSRRLDMNGRGAALFVDALAGAAPEFSVSLRSTDDDALIEADGKIACAPGPVTSAASGGVLHYRRRFPDDPMLRLWSGLVLAHSGHPALAVAEFAGAIDQGCGHWRASWYLAQAARRASAFDLARDALQRVIHAAPRFQPARDLLASMAACA
jgi:hypothetical protein